MPSNFVDFIQDNESRLASTLGNDQDQNFINHAGIGSEGENILDLHSPTLTDSSLADHGAGTPPPPQDPSPLRGTLGSCMAWRAIPGPLSKRKRRLDSLEA